MFLSPCRSPTLIESELFGHRKGAFTGALDNRLGYFEACSAHGTVFLDEIGEIEASVQVKLLRVLQTRQYQRLGDTTALNFLGKVMAATNRDLSKEIQEGRFREDFYYRLCADTIETLALKDILADSANELPVFIHHILVKMLGQDDATSLQDEVMTAITKHVGSNHPWRGNFRELEQCVRNIVIHGNYKPDRQEDRTVSTFHIRALAAQKLTVDKLLAHYTREIYTTHGNNLEATACILEIDRRTVKKYISKAS